MNCAIDPITPLMLTPRHASFNGTRQKYAQLIEKASRNPSVCSKFTFFAHGLFTSIKLAAACPATLVQNTLDTCAQVCSCELVEAWHLFLGGLTSSLYYLRAAIILPFLLFVGLFSPTTFARFLSSNTLGAPGHQVGGRRRGEDQADIRAARLARLQATNATQGNAAGNADGNAAANVDIGAIQEVGAQLLREQRRLQGEVTTHEATIASLREQLQTVQEYAQGLEADQSARNERRLTEAGLVEISREEIDTLKRNAAGAIPPADQELLDDVKNRAQRILAHDRGNRERVDIPVSRELLKAALPSLGPPQEGAGGGGGGGEGTSSSSN